jgi:DNA polymerase (family 10)
MQSEEVARVLDEMGTLLEIRGENPFRCRAYHNAAQALRGLTGDLGEMLADGRLARVPGIGETILSKVTQLVSTGHLPAFENLRAETPPGLVALLRISGLGPKKILTLHKDLGVESLADLREAAEAGRIAGLKGFGAKTQTQILAGIDFVERAGHRILQSTARRLAAPILRKLREDPRVIRAEICGSLRRRAETAGDLDLLFSAVEPGLVLDDCVKFAGVARVLGHGPTKVSIVLADGIQCDIRGVAEEQFPFALHYFTGSKAHNIAMRRRAIARGLTLNEYALDGPAGAVPCSDEAGIFKALGLHYIPPELREDRGEFALAEAGPLPPLIELGDLEGTFHCHSDWSDGGNTLEEMAEAAIQRGLEYLGIADHSRSAGYAGGLSIDRVREQWEAIDALNQRFGSRFRLFKGIECDILADGSLDYPDDLLAGFDYVVASVHSGFSMGREEMTARLGRAASHPLVTMLGHPSGRLLLRRDAYPVDLEAVLKTAARAGTMVEINASPHRLDVDDLHARRAAELGLLVPINPDAHSTGGLDDLEYGIGVARRAGLGPAAVLNTRPRSEVEAVFAASRARAGG